MSDRRMRLGRTMLAIALWVGACTTAESQADTQVRMRSRSQLEDAVVGTPTVPAVAVAEPDTRAEAPASIPPEVVEVPADARIVMQRTRCYGACPAYLVQLDADGTVEWDGHAHVRKKGKATASISTDAFAELWRALAAVATGDLPHAATDLDTPLCPELFSDHPTARVTLESGGNQQHVHDDQGCMGNAALDSFRALETRIDEVAGTARWIRR